MNVVQFQAMAKPAMPTAAKHRRALAPFTDDDGRVNSADVHAGTRLIPIDDCRAIIAELEAALAPCPGAPALVFAKQLIGCYRIKDVVDAKIYVSTMAEKFKKFPPDICGRIVDAVTDTLKFPPSPADVMAGGQGFLREREAALFTARKHAEEHQRRKEAASEATRLKAERAKRDDVLKAAYAKAGLGWPGSGKASWVKVAMAGMGEEGGCDGEESKIRKSAE